MAQLTLACPHCRAEKTGFAYRQHHQARPQSPHTLLFLQCEGCGEGLIAVIKNPQHIVAQWAGNQVAGPGEIIRIYPAPSALKSPADTPPSVQSAYLSGLDNLSRKGGTNAAAIMFRRSVEIAVKTLNPNAAKGDNLKKRIDDLSANLATPAMKEWAHHIRLEANDATHEPEEFTAEDANALQTFAELFLTYAFTLPEMLKRAKAQTGMNAPSSPP